MTAIFILEIEYALDIPCQTDNSPKCVNGSVLSFERIIRPILSVVSVKTAIKDIPLKQNLQWYFCQTFRLVRSGLKLATRAGVTQCSPGGEHCVTPARSTAKAQKETKMTRSLTALKHITVTTYHKPQD